MFRKAAGAGLLALVCGRLLSPSAAAEAAPANPWWEGYVGRSTLVSLPDGRKLNLYCEGRGSPIVIFESGAGSGAWTWRFVQDEVAKTTRACAYDRAGLGRSPPGPEPRNIRAQVGDLEQLLAAGGLNGPYVLVGHSMGGMIARTFASRHEDEVAGLLLIDPATENQYDRFEEVAPGYEARSKAARGARQAVCAQEPRPAKAQCGFTGVFGPDDVPGALADWKREAQGPAAWQGAWADAGGLDRGGASGAEVVAERRPLKLPVILLERDANPKPPHETQAQYEAIETLWRVLQVETAELYAGTTPQIVPGATHNIQLERPAVVIAAVRRLVDQARAGDGR